MSLVQRREQRKVCEQKPFELSKSPKGYYREVYGRMKERWNQTRIRHHKHRHRHNLKGNKMRKMPTPIE